MMEIRENIESAKSVDEMKLIKTKNESEIGQVIKELSGTFKSKDFDKARSLTIKL
ncbi:hypothetical protein AX774_g5997, partial [Zancudomyces culisetae]